MTGPPAVPSDRGRSEEESAEVPRPARPSGLEWAGWALLALTTLAIVLLAVLRPTDPGSLVNEIRLAAGFDRYAAAMEEGDRLYRTAVAELRLADEDDEEGRDALLRMFAEASERFQTAREEAEGFHEDQRAQIEIARVHYAWARQLLERGDRPWYRRDDTETLQRAIEIVEEALALPDLPGEVRNELEELKTRIERAKTPWPVL
ncbi:MAG: hypothetical protein R3326_00905 [Gemmatimonadota bacterium]|nr:hypothetical protein [Gemmatimonadota bacterium]